MEFMNEIRSRNTSTNELNSAVNITDILEKVEEILKDQ